ncbi:MAG: glycosyltransferase family 4 protein [Planctomycetota bacterium]
MGEGELLLATSEFPPFEPGCGGGVGTWMEAVARGLAESAGAGSCVAVGSSPRMAGTTPPYPIYRIPDRLHRHARSVAWRWALHQASRRRPRPRALLLATRQMARTPLAWARARGIPTLLFCHGQEWLVRDQPSHERRTQQLIERTPPDLYVANSRYTQSLLEGRGIPASRIVRVRPVSDLARFATADAGRLRRRLGLGDALVLLGAGRLVERKGHDVLVEVAARLLPAFPTLHVVLAGEGPCRGAIEATVQRLGLDKRVHMLGQVDHDELQDVFAAADVFAMATRDLSNHGSVEGYGIVYVEAGAAGVPVVATPVGGVVDVVQDDENGIFVKSADVDDVAAGVASLLADPGKRARLGQRGRELATGAYGLEEQTRVLLDAVAQAEAIVARSSS